MSWIFGFVGERVPNQLQSEFVRIHPQPLLQHQSSSLYIATGGIPQTCLFEHTNQTGQPGETGWVVVGLGIQKSDLSCRILDRGDWRKILTAEVPDLSALDGHYIALCWNGKQVECYSDHLGMRKIYFTPAEGGIVFSTRLDWITKFRNEFDFNEFGSQWLTFNHLSYESFIKGIHRLGPGGVAHCTPSRIEIKNKPFEINQIDQRISIDHILAAFLNPVHDQELTLSLGLSGGLDSRVLFGLLLSGTRPAFTLHLFGNPTEPDVMIAQRMAQKYGIEQIFFPESVSMEELNPDLMKEYVAKTSLALPVSSFTKLRFYSRLHQMKKIMIDGGMGEIGRRQFLNRLYFKASGKKISVKPKMIGRYIRMHHASIFVPEVEKIMEGGIESQLERALSEMPSIEDIGLENLIDLFIVRFRFPNYAGLDQSRFDEEIVNYMPFAQPSFIQAVFQMPQHERRNGKYYRTLIRSLDPLLTRYPLVKGTVTYPFVLPTLPGWLYTKVKSKAGFSYRNGTRDEFLHSMKSYIYDTVKSESVKSWSAYNYNNIVHLVDRYFSGEKTLSSDLDWFLTFELWRQNLGIR
jgi:hypothetical protein